MKKSLSEELIKERCMDISKKSPYLRCRHGAILTYRGEILSEACNIALRNDFTKKYDTLKSLHAEAAVIMRALKHHNNKIINKCELWVCRSNKNTCISRPCPMCERIIKAFGIKKVHYTNKEGEWKEMEMEDETR